MASLFEATLAMTRSPPGRRMSCHQSHRMPAFTADLRALISQLTFISGLAGAQDPSERFPGRPSVVVGAGVRCDGMRSSSSRIR